MRLGLLHPIDPARRKVRAIELRPPGRKAIAVMIAARGAEGFTDEQAIRFGARLSGLSELTLRRLRNDDLARVKTALEDLIAAARDAQSVGTAVEGDR